MSDTVKIYDELIQRLLENENVYICGPDGTKKGKLRVYVNGGKLCWIPPRKTIDSLAVEFGDHDYIAHLEEDDRNRLIEKNMIVPNTAKAACEIKTESGSKFYGWGSKDLRLKIMLDEWDALFQMTTDKFSDEAERKVQTEISRAHRDYLKHNAVVFDFEHCVPSAEFADMKKWGSKEKGVHARSSKPKFDMVVFSVPETGPTFTIVELKCNREACEDDPNQKGSGLEDHALDMYTVCSFSKEQHTNPDYKEKENLRKLELLRRLKMLVDENLLLNLPADIDIDQLSKNPKTVHLESAFLFVDGQVGQRDYSILCERYISKELRGQFGYQYAASAKDVNLSEWKEWTSFSVQK